MTTGALSARVSWSRLAVFVTAAFLVSGFFAPNAQAVLIFETRGGGSASVITSPSGSESVQLSVVNGATDIAAVVIPVDIQLDQVADLAFWQTLPAGSAPFGSNIILGVDADGDGTYESNDLNWHIGATLHSAAELGDDSFIEMDGVSVGSSWASVDAVSVPQWWTPDITGTVFDGCYSTLANLVSACSGAGHRIDASDHVKFVKILIGGSGSWNNLALTINDAELNSATLVGGGVAIIPATGGMGISIDTANTTNYTILSDLRLVEDHSNSIGLGTVDFTLPTGFEYKQTGNPTTVALGAGDLTISSPIFVSPTVIRLTVTGQSTVASEVRISGINVRPTQTNPLPSGDIQVSGTAGVTGVAATLSTVSGAPTQLAFTVQPPSTAVAGVTFTAFNVAINDQYGNLTPATDSILVEAVDPASTNAATALSLTPGLNGATSLSAALGTAIFSDVSYSNAVALKIKASHPGLTPILSPVLSVLETGIQGSVAISGGSGTVSADTAVSGVGDAIAPIILTETAPSSLKKNTGVGDVVLSFSAPAGFVFDTASVPSVIVTGGEASIAGISGFVGDTLQVTLDITTMSATGTGAAVTIGGTTPIKVKATNGSSLAVSAPIIAALVSGDVNGAGTGVGTLGEVLGNLTETFGAVHHLELSNIAEPLIAGTHSTATVAAQDQFGNRVTNYSDTVTFSTDDLAAEIPANYTFVSGDAGIHEFSFIFKTAFERGGNTFLKVEQVENPTISDTQNDITVRNATLHHLAVTGAPSSVVAGVPFSVTVTVYDEFGNVMTGTGVGEDYTGTVHFSSTDVNPSTILPADHVFTHGTGMDNGVYSTDVTLTKAGTQSVTATDTVILTATGTQSGIVVNSADAVALGFQVQPAGSVSGSALTTQPVVRAVDLFGNTDTNYVGLVTLTESSVGVLTNDAATAVLGEATFSGLTYAATVDHETFTLEANSDALASATSNLVDSDVVATQFTVTLDSPAVTAGTPTSLRLEAVDGQDVLDVDYNENGKTYTFSDTLANNLSTHLSPDGSPPVLPSSVVVQDIFSDGVANPVPFALVKAETLSEIVVNDGTISGTSGSLIVNPAATTNLGLAVSPTSPQANVSFDLTVRAQDEFHNVTPGYTGTVVFSFVSGAPNTTGLPNNQTFVLADSGVRVLPITLSSSQDDVHIRATDIANAAIQGNAIFNVIPQVFSGLTVSAIPVNNLGQATGLYLQGWRYTFNLIVNNLNETNLFLKFKDWENTANPLQRVEINGNTRLLINTAGGMLSGVLTNAMIESDSGSVKSFALGNTFSEQLHNGLSEAINVIDSDPITPGLQVQFDIFTKLPETTTPGFYKTDFCIKAEITPGVPDDSGCSF